MMPTLRQLAQQLEQGQTSARQLTEQLLSQVANAQERFNVFINVTEEMAMATADRVDKLRRRGCFLPPLAGVPVAVKDNILIEGTITTCASRMLEDYVSPYTATVMERLSLSPLLGKTNMDEFAMGSSTLTSAYGPSGNPWDEARVPGGSSGGSAAAVAAGCTPFALGSDTGGSVRQPAAFCGVTGLRPTWGRVSRRGLVAFASSLDQVGILAPSAEDCALVLQTIAGHDSGDATSSHQPVSDYLGGINQGVKGLTIGILRDRNVDNQQGIDMAVDKAAAMLEKAGATLVEMDMPYGKEALAAYHVIAPVELYSNLARFDGIRYGYRAAGHSYREILERSRCFGSEVKLRLVSGVNLLQREPDEKFYAKARQARKAVTDCLHNMLREVDLLLSPSAPLVAFSKEEKNDLLAMYFNDYHAIPASLAGLPAISLPCGLVNGLPVGMQLVAPAWSEELLLQAGHAWQCISHWHTLTPGRSAQ